MEGSSEKEGFLNENGEGMVGSDDGKLRESSLSLLSLWHTVPGRDKLNPPERMGREVPWQEVLSRFLRGGDSGKLRCEREGSRRQLKSQQKKDKWQE